MSDASTDKILHQIHHNQSWLGHMPDWFVSAVARVVLVVYLFSPYRLRETFSLFLNVLFNSRHVYEHHAKRIAFVLFGRNMMWVFYLVVLGLYTAGMSLISRRARSSTWEQRDAVPNPREAF